MTVTPDATLEQLVLADPGLAAVFDRLGLDFCCHGDRTVAQACATAGVPVAGAIAAVEAAAGTADAADAGDWTGYGPAELARHIQAAHHVYLTAELPELVSLADKVAGVHGDRHPELAEVTRLVRALHDELLPHLAKEDRVLFPAIAALEAGPASFGFGTVANPIAVMTAEHEAAGELLGRLAAATSGYETPADGCASYALLYRRLAHLEADTHLHVLKENSVLFPAACALEAERQAAPAS